MDAKNKQLPWIKLEGGCLILPKISAKLEFPLGEASSFLLGIEHACLDG